MTFQHPLADGRTDSAPIVRAVRGDRPDHAPIWFPGRAGRALAAEGDTSPSADAITTQTLRLAAGLGVDAVDLAIDVLLPLRLAGVRVERDAGGTPFVPDPICSASDVLGLRPIDPDTLQTIQEATTRAVAALGATPLIAVGVAPFTLAAVLVEGGPSHDLVRTRAMMVADPNAWAGLLNWCADVTGESLRAQVQAGASVVQLRDDRVGVLGRTDYFKRVLPHSRRALSHLRGIDLPTIHSGVGGGDFLDLMARVLSEPSGVAGEVAVGVDWRIPLDDAAVRTGPGVPLLGNIDPAFLDAPPPLLAAHIADVLERGKAAPAHVVALGGEVPDHVDEDVLRRVVDLVRSDAS